MQLLVSVRNLPEAESALDGGADIIDAKEPRGGALGQVELPTFERIVAAVSGRRPVSAALGDLRDDATARRDAHAFGAAGATFVKAGFAGIDSEVRIATLLSAAVAGASASRTHVVAVAYADHATAGTLPFDRVLHVARESGARGVLLDTAVKDGLSLSQLVPVWRLEQWVDRARAEGCSVALAGRVTLPDLAYVVSTGAEIVGVRGAACDGGRDGAVSAEKVRRLQAALRDRTHRTPPTAALAAAFDGSRHRR
jgi:dihydroneopterin aldolase